MAAFDLEEQEQISQIKGWWEQYGTLVTGLAVAVALASVGWQGWQWYQGKQSAEASALYGVLQKAASEKNAQKAREAAGTLLEKYNGTAYADMAALLSAKVQADAGDLKNARVPLAWAATKANDPALRELARLRLATVMFDDKAYDEALKQLDGARAAALDARFLEMKGDVLAAQGKRPDARAAYKSALEKSADKAGAGRELLQQKLDSLGEAA